MNRNTRQTGVRENDLGLELRMLSCAVEFQCAFQHDYQTLLRENQPPGNDNFFKRSSCSKRTHFGLNFVGNAGDAFLLNEVCLFTFHFSYLELFSTRLDKNFTLKHFQVCLMSNCPFLHPSFRQSVHLFPTSSF